MAFWYGYTRKVPGSVGMVVFWVLFGAYMSSIVNAPPPPPEMSSILFATMWVIKSFLAYFVKVLFLLSGLALAWFSGQVLRYSMKRFNYRGVGSNPRFLMMIVSVVSSSAGKYLSRGFLVGSSLFASAMISTIMNEVDRDSSGFTEAILFASIALVNRNDKASFVVGALTAYAFYAKFSESLMKRMLVHWRIVYLQQRSEA